MVGLRAFGAGGGRGACLADPLEAARSRLPGKKLAGGVIWLLQFALAALVLLLLWQPAILVAELRPQQNIIAVLVDDSRSMSIADAGGGATREAQAIKALDGGVLDQLQKKFQFASTGWTGRFRAFRRSTT